MRIDEAVGELLDAQGGALFHTGEPTRIRGTVIEVRGDPSPCFSTLGMNVEEIVRP